MAELREFGGLWRNLDQDAARACNGASQVLYKHPRGAFSHTFAKAFLPRFVRDLFEYYCIANGHHLMHLASMQALAMSYHPPLSFGFAATGLLIAFARLPLSRLLSLLLDASLLVVVLRVGRSPLPIHSALQPTDGFGIRL